MSTSEEGTEPIPEQRNGDDEDLAQHERAGDERDLAEHERPTRDEPETGLIADEELPEDVRPSDDNPLAKDPEDEDDSSGSASAKVEGMPDMGTPGSPA